MATLAAPTVSISGAPGSAGIAGLVLPAAEATAAVSTTTVPNNGSVLVRIVNGGAAAITVSFVVQKTILGEPVTQNMISESVANGVTKIYGPFPPSVFNDVNGSLNITFSAVTSVTVGAYSLPGSVAGF